MLREEMQARGGAWARRRSATLEDAQEIVMSVGEGRRLRPIVDVLGGLRDGGPGEERLVAGDDDLVRRRVPVFRPVPALRHVGDVDGVEAELGGEALD